MIIEDLNSVKCYFCNHVMRHVFHGRNSFVCQQNDCKATAHYFDTQTDNYKSSSSNRIENLIVKFDAHGSNFHFRDEEFYSGWSAAFCEQNFLYFKKHKVMYVPHEMKLVEVLNYITEYYKHVNVSGFCEMHEKNLSILS